MVRKLIILPIALVAFACAKDDNKKVDDALNADLSTAAQANPVMPLDSVSAMERNALVAAPAAAAAPVVRSSNTTNRAPVRRTSSTTRRRSSSGSSGGTYSEPSTVYYPAPARREPQVIKNTKRDAAIGAAAGAVLGAATSKNKVKGAIIGGTAGAIIGGVIGNNVDVKRR